MRVEPYRLPFPQPVTTAQGTFTAREGWRLWLGEGVGDVAPWPGFGAGVEAVGADLGRVVEGADPHTPEVAGALATADLVSRAHAARSPLAALLHGAAAAAVESHVLVADAAAAQRSPATALKVKVGAADLGADLARVARVRRARPDARLRLDANGAWQGDAAHRAVAALAAFEPEWIEQPVPPGDLDALRSLRALAPIAADESVTDAAALEALIEAGAADVIVLKPAFVGGAQVAWSLARRARAAGLRVCVTHAMGSAVDRWIAVHVACALAAEGPVAAGLGGGPTDAAFAGPVITADGRVHRSAAPGLGLR